MIEVQGLGKCYQRFSAPWAQKTGRKTEEALCDVSLTVGFGEVYGLLGANGAGKTTLLRLLTTSLAPTAGTATVAGWDIRKSPPEVRRRIGFVSQETEVYRG